MNQAPQIYTDKNGLQQVSLELTAEIIRLSPFGRPDSPEGTQQLGAHANPYAAPQPGGNQFASEGQGEQAGYGSPQPSYGSSQAQGGYGAPQQQRGYGSFPPSGQADSQNLDDDKLPF